MRDLAELSAPPGGDWLCRRSRSQGLPLGARLSGPWFSAACQRTARILVGCFSCKGRAVCPSCNRTPHVRGHRPPHRPRAGARARAPSRGARGARAARALRGRGRRCVWCQACGLVSRDRVSRAEPPRLTGHARLPERRRRGHRRSGSPNTNRAPMGTSSRSTRAPDSSSGTTRMGAPLHGTSPTTYWWTGDSTCSCRQEPRSRLGRSPSSSHAQRHRVATAGERIPGRIVRGTVSDLTREGS